MNDKILHLMAGALVAMLARLYGFTPAEAIVAAAVLGLGKEVYDLKSGKGTPDPIDFAATALGGAVGGLFPHA